MVNFSLGIMSSVLCQQIAEAAVHDIEAAKSGFEHPKLKALASVKGITHVEGHIHKSLKNECVLPNPYVVNMPYSTGDQPTSILLPHEYFAAMFNEGWEETVVPDADKVEAFWMAAGDHPAMVNHPVKTRERWQRKCIPLALHGDEVPVVGVGKVWSRSVLTFLVFHDCFGCWQYWL